MNLQTQNRNWLIFNLTAGILIFILNVRFSVAYYSYFIDISLLALIYDVYVSHKNGNRFIPFDKDIKWMISGTFVFYGMLVLSSVLLQDFLSVRWAFGLFSYAYPMFVFMILARKYDIAKGFAVGLAVAAFVSAAYSLLQLGPLVDTLKYPPRIQGFYRHPNNLGLAIELLTPFLISYFLSAKSRIVKLVLVATFILEMMSLYFTRSRGPIASLAIGGTLAILVSMFYYRKSLSKRVIGIVLSALAIFGIFACGTFLYWNQNRTMGERKMMAIASVEMWKDHKLLGVGMARWSENYYSPRYHPEGASEEDLEKTHNMPLYFASTAGSLGLGGYLILNGITLVILCRQIRNTRNLWISIAALASYLAMMTESMIDITIASKIGGLQFYALLGYAIGMWRPQSQIKKELQL